MVRIIYLLIIFLSYTAYNSLVATYEKHILLLTLLAVLLSIILFCREKEKVAELKRQYIRPVYTFILGYIIVHFQVYLDYLAGNVGSITPITSAVATNKSSLLALGGLASFMLGYRLFQSNKNKYDKIERSYRPLSIKPLVLIAALMLCALIGMFGSYYFSSEYGSVSTEGSMQAYIELIFSVLLYGIIVVNSRNASIVGLNTLKSYILSFGLLFWCILLIYFLLIMISGDRGPIIYFSAAIFFSYIIVTKKKISLVPISLILLCAAVLISIMGIARSLDKEMTYAERFTKATQGNENYSVSPYTAELSWSVRTLEYAVDYVPDKHPYLNGLFKVNEIIAIVPFISNFTKDYMDQRFQYKGSTSFLTWIEQGDNPSSGAGATVVADLYIDFGWIGVIIGLFLLGLLFRRLDCILFCNEISQISLFSLIMGIVIFAMAIYISRSTLLFNLRSIVWIWVVVSLYQLIKLRNVRR